MVENSSLETLPSYRVSVGWYHPNSSELLFSSVHMHANDIKIGKNFQYIQEKQKE